MKKIIVDCCFECPYRGVFENGYADCLHEKADGIAIHESNQEYRNIHPSCPLPDEPQPTISTDPRNDANAEVHAVRVIFRPTDTSETFIGTVIEETKHSYLVIPDDNLNGTARWNKNCCEVIR